MDVPRIYDDNSDDNGTENRRSGGDGLRAPFLFPGVFRYPAAVVPPRLMRQIEQRPQAEHFFASFRAISPHLGRLQSAMLFSFLSAFPKRAKLILYSFSSVRRMAVNHTMISEISTAGCFFGPNIPAAAQIIRPFRNGQWSKAPQNASARAAKMTARAGFFVCFGNPYASARPSAMPRRTMPTMTAITQATWPGFSFSFRNTRPRMTETMQ